MLELHEKAIKTKGGAADFYLKVCSTTFFRFVYQKVITDGQLPPSDLESKVLTRQTVPLLPTDLNQRHAAS